MYAKYNGGFESANMFFESLIWTENKKMTKTPLFKFINKIFQPQLFITTLRTQKYGKEHEYYSRKMTQSWNKNYSDGFHVLFISFFLCLCEIEKWNVRNYRKFFITVFGTRILYLTLFAFVVSGRAKIAKVMLFVTWFNQFIFMKHARIAYRHYP